MSTSATYSGVLQLCMVIDFWKKTIIWCSNSLFYLKYQQRENVYLSNIKSCDPMHMSPLCYHRANATCNMSVVIYIT